MEKKKWTEKLISDIVNNITCSEQMIVPIIGTGVYYAEENGVVYNNIQEFIVKKVLEDKDCPQKCTEGNIKRFSNGYRGMTQLKKVCGDCFYRLIRDVLLDKTNLSKIKLDSDVLEFLELGHFPLILTTCNFSHLEKSIKYDGKSYELVAYRKGKDQDIETDHGNLVHPTIFHLFGIAGPSEHVVFTEDSFLHYLHCVQDTNTRPDHIKDYLKDRYILSLGCDIPDWTFRFLLYSLKEKDGSLIGRNDDKIFDGGALSMSLDEDLANFLSDISYYSDKDLNAFLNDINKLLAPDDRPTIFLSVNSEEYDTLGDQIESILKRKFKVWYFKHNGGKQYWKEIEEGVKNCDYFMPVTTSYSITKFFDPDSAQDRDVSPGIVTELRFALENKNKYKGQQKYCIPYVTVPDKLLKTALDQGSCKDLWPLFFSNEGTEHITTPIAELTAEEVWNYIYEKK